MVTDILFTRLHMLSMVTYWNGCWMRGEPHLDGGGGMLDLMTIKPLNWLLLKIGRPFFVSVKTKTYILWASD